MARRNGNLARLEQDLPNHFSYRPSSQEINRVVREYIVDGNVSFTEMCELAVLEFIRRNPRWPHKNLQLPRGKRPRLT